MNFAELSDLSDEQLVHAELSLERNLVTARFQHATNQLADSSQLKKLRRDIARIRTACRTRELENGLRKNALRDQYATSFVPAAADATEGSASGGFLSGIVDKIGGDE